MKKNKLYVGQLIYKPSVISPLKFGLFVDHLELCGRKGLSLKIHHLSIRIIVH